MRCLNWKLLGFLGITLFAASPVHTEVMIGLAGSLTGPNAWLSEQTQRGAELAVVDLNASGGVLGERVDLLEVDDYCESEQAVAAARKLVAADVVVVAGHGCSAASIAASIVYAEAGILMISPGSTKPQADRGGLRPRFPSGRARRRPGQDGRPLSRRALGR